MWLLLADLHIRGALLQSTDQTIRWIKELVSIEKPSHILLLGDTFHFRDKLGVETICAVRELLQHFLDANDSCIIHILVGNHDMCDVVNRNPNSVSVFGLHARIHCYSDITTTTIDGRDVLLIPFHNDHNEVMHYLESFEGNRTDTVVFAHLALLGAIHHGQHRCFRNGIDPSYFDDFSHTFMGHFHKHSVYGEKKNIVYVGSPIQHSWNEASDLQKGAVLYDPSTGEWNLNVNPNARRYLRVSMSEAREDMRAAVINTSKYRDKNVRLIQDSDGCLDDSAQIIRALETTAGASNAVCASVARKDSSASGGKPDEELEQAFSAIRTAEAFVQAQHDSGHVQGEMRDSLLAYIRSLNEKLERSSDRAAGTVTFACDVHDMSIENFLGVKGTVRFTFRDWAKGVYLVQGPNGAGKSTIMEALYWAIYGDSLRGLKVKDDIVNTKGKRCIVRVAFSNGYIVTRERHKNSECLVVKDPSGTSHRKVDGASLIQQFMHFDKTEFLRISMLDARQIHAITSTDPKKRKAIYCKLLGFGILDTYLKAIETDKADAKRKVAELARISGTAEVTSQTARNRLEDAIERLGDKMRDYEQNSEALRTVTEEFVACKQVMTSQADSHHAAALRLALLKQQVADMREASQNARSSVSEATNTAAAFLHSASHAHILTLHEALNACQDKLRKRIDEHKGYEQAKHIELNHVQEAHRDEYRHDKCVSDLQQRIDDNAASHAKLMPGYARLSSLQSAQMQLERTKKTLQEKQNEIKLAQHHEALREPIERILKVIDRSIQDMEEAADDQRAATWRTQIYQPLDNLVPKLPTSQCASTLDAVNSHLEETNRQLVAVIEDMFVLRIELDEIGRKEAEFINQNVERNLRDAKNQSALARLVAESHLRQVTRLTNLCSSATSEISHLQKMVEYSRQDIRDAQANGHLLDTETMNRLDDLRRNIAAAEEVRINTEASLASRDDELRDAEISLEQIKVYATNCNERYRTLEQKVTALEAKVVYINACINEDNGKLNALKHASHELDNDRVRADDARLAAVNHMLVIDAWHTYLAKEGTFRTFCLERSATAINVRLERNMNLLCQDDNHDPKGNDISCMLDVKTLELVAKGSGLAMAKRSDGQRRRSHLALFFSYFEAAQSHAAFRPKWLFLDEIFDALDNDGQHAVLRWIADYASINQDVFIFVVSHSAAVDASSNKIFAGQLQVTWDKTKQSSQYTVKPTDRPGWELREDIKHECHSTPTSH